jgi:hypothetical protein
VDLIRRYPELVQGAVVSEPPIGALAPDAFAAMIATSPPPYSTPRKPTGPAMPPYTFTQADVAVIHVPVLVLAGSQSHPALRTGARALASWLPDARFLELNCGHVTYAEQPADFAHAVSAFAHEITARRLNVTADHRGAICDPVCSSPRRVSHRSYLRPAQQ